jgi:hypothetical protein
MYFEITVSFKRDTEKGKPKEDKVTYLVEDTHSMPAETKLTEKLIESGEADFRVVSKKESKVSMVL